MLYYLTAAALIAHTLFWGLGLAWWVAPRGWRHWAWALAPGLGMALQSAVVWVGAHTALTGTNSYALASELLPFGLLAVAMRSGWPDLRRRLHAVTGGWRWAAMSVVAGGILLWPMAQRGAWTLTASSLGSCDHADYAAGARVFQEFARNDHTGFLGLTEVTRVGTAGDFFDFWLRINHFTPSALLAHNGAVFGLQCHQLVSLTGVLLVLFNGALVLLLARVVLRLRGPVGLLPAALYLLSPLGAYAVHHGALGQLYGAHGIALLTLAVIGANRYGAKRALLWAWAPLVLAAFWILAGSYNFILTVALAPAFAWLLADAIRRRDWAGPARVAGMVLVTLAACAALFWGRFDGLIERFQLFEQYNFGWPVPILSPEGWLGIVRDPALHAWPHPVRWVLAIIVAGGWAAALAVLGRSRRSTVWGALALMLPVLAGWSMLVWEARTRSNASYDAYKLLSVFFPGLLVGLTAWLAAPGRLARRVAVGVVLVVLLVNGWVGWQFARAMAIPPLRVDRVLLELRRLDRMPRLTSLNMRIDDYWSRLWANALLLHKPQYFSVHTYEGRLNTALKGEWDLSDSLLRSQPLRESDYVDVNAHFHAVRVAATGRVDLAFGSGWHAMERFGVNRWRWSSGPATIRVYNPANSPVSATLHLRVRSLQRGRLHVELGDARLPESHVVHGNVEELAYRDVSLPPGNSTLTLVVDFPPGRADEHDPRLLGLALYELVVRAER